MLQRSFLNLNSGTEMEKKEETFELFLNGKLVILMIHFFSIF